jgi:glucose-6-phosphate isomerase
MLHLEIANTGIKDYSKIKSKLEKIKKQKLPIFETYSEDINKLKLALKKYSKYRNLIVIGNGGSNTSFKAYDHALTPMSSKKKAFILTTMEPDLLNELKENFPKRKTLIMPISKSGTTIGTLESMFAFEGYPVLPVTSPDTGALSVLAKKDKLDIIPHPPVGGRYSGLTASAFAPALIMGIDVESINNGARTMYKYCNPQVPIDKNPALRIAAVLFLIDKKGCEEIF